MLMSCRKPPTLSDHLWILSRLFAKQPEGGKKTEKGDNQEIKKYVLAMCHRKISRRLDSDLSKKCIDALKSVKAFAFKDAPRVDRPSTTANKTGAKALKSEQNARLKAFRSDQNLMAGYISHFNSLEEKPINIPNIQALYPKMERRENFQLYTKDTCMEFHILLLYLLETIQEALSQLNALIPSPQPGDPKPTGPNIDKSLSNLFLAGDALCRIVRGSGIWHHMYNINMFLKDPRRSATNPQKPTLHTIHNEDKFKVVENTVTSEAVLEPQVEVDVEVELSQYAEWEDLVKEADDLVSEPDDPVSKSDDPVSKRDDPASKWDDGVRAVQSQSYGIPLTQVYVDWLRLLVAHFDGVGIVKKYVRNVERINVKILVAPTVTNDYLPWQELFANPEFFGENADRITNDIIFQFLKGCVQKLPLINQAVELFASAMRAWSRQGEPNSRNTAAWLRKLKKFCEAQEQVFVSQAEGMLDGALWAEAERWTSFATKSKEILDAIKLYHEARGNAQKAASLLSRTQITDASSEVQITSMLSGVEIMDTSLGASGAEIMVPSSGALLGAEIMDTSSGASSDGKMTNTPSIASIAEALTELQKSLLVELDNNQLPFILEPERGFGGTLHCETCLASILHSETRKTLSADPQYEDVLKATEVS